MCGIFGLWRKSRDVSVVDLERCRDAMTHRGPDDGGSLVWDSQGIGLAHRRLSIIDLSPLGHQPMLTTDGAYAIVFNGEIYNYRELRAELEARGHRFTSQSDTEAILLGYRQWGRQVVDRLNGMFAFAIAEKPTGRLFLARDRAGEKPLYYYWDGSQFIFASELKAILQWPGIPRRIDVDAFNSYLALGYVPGSECLLKGAAKLPPGHALEFHHGRLEVQPYWSLRSPAAPLPPVEDADLVREFDALLSDSVRRQLVADVPVGVLLSGGVDSSLITALAARVSGRIKTFTVSFRGHGRFDESPHARLIAQTFGTDHHELEGSAITPEILPTLAAQFDEPIADSSMIPTYLVSALVRKHCTVALGGDGGDELFGGYNHHQQLLNLQRLAIRTPAALRRSAAGLCDRLLPTGFRGRNLAMSFGALGRKSRPLPAPQFDHTARRRLLRRQLWHAIAQPYSPETSRHALAQPFADGIQRYAGTDFLTYLPDDVLVKVDRASMLCSLELRAPLLDYRIVEFAFRRVPDRLKATSGGKKILGKMLARTLLPPQFDFDRKQGFSLPLADWLTSSWRSEFQQYVRLLPDDLFAPKAVDQLWGGARVSKGNSERLFALALFGLWMDRHRMSF